MCEDREDKFIIVLETIGEIFERHDRVFHFFSEKCFFEKIIEFDLIELSDNEDIDDVIRVFITKVEDRFRNRHEVEIFPSFEKFFYRSHDIVRLQKHISYMLVDRTVAIHRVVFFLILLVGLEYSEMLEVHELTTDSIDLFIGVTTEFTDKKPDTTLRDSIFDHQFFEKLDARTRTKQFDEIQRGRRKKLTNGEYMGKKGKCKTKYTLTISP